MAVKSRDVFASDAGVTKVTTTGTVANSSNTEIITTTSHGSWDTCGWFSANKAIVLGDQIFTAITSSGANTAAFCGLTTASGLDISNQVAVFMTIGNTKGLINGSQSGSGVALNPGDLRYFRFTIHDDTVDLDYSDTGFAGNYTAVMTGVGYVLDGVNGKIVFDALGVSSETYTSTGFYFCDSGGLTPPAPGNPTATPLSTTTVHITWSDGSATTTNADSIIILRSPHNAGSYDALDTVQIGTGEYTDTTAFPGTSYDYILKASLIAPVADPNFQQAFNSSATSIATATTANPPSTTTADTLMAMGIM